MRRMRILDYSTGGLAEAAGALVLRTSGGMGPAAVRNLGAARAWGDVLVFIDADLCVHVRTLERILARFENEPEDVQRIWQDLLGPDLLRRPRRLPISAAGRSRL